MSGIELGKEVLARGLARKVIFMSGYTDDIVNGKDLPGSGTELLSKPFSPDTLLCKVRVMLYQTKRGK